MKLRIMFAFSSIIISNRARCFAFCYYNPEFRFNASKFVGTRLKIHVVTIISADK